MESKLRINLPKLDWDPDVKECYDRMMDILCHTKDFTGTAKFEDYEILKAKGIEHNNKNVVVMGGFYEHTMEGNIFYFVMFNTKVCGLDSRTFRKYGLMRAYRWNESSELGEFCAFAPDDYDYNADDESAYTWIYVNPEYSDEEKRAFEESRSAKLNDKETVKVWRW